MTQATQALDELRAEAPDVQLLRVAQALDWTQLPPSSCHVVPLLESVDSGGATSRAAGMSHTI